MNVLNKEQNSNNKNNARKSTARKKTYQTLNKENYDNKNLNIKSEEPLSKKIKKNLVENFDIKPKEKTPKLSKNSLNLIKNIDTILSQSAPSKKSKENKQTNETELEYFYAKNEIDRLITCVQCHKYFNFIDKLPKIVCDKLTLCSSCINSSHSFINCNQCNYKHPIQENGNQINPTILSLIKLKPTKLKKETIGDDFLLNLKIQSSIEQLQTDLNQADKFYELIKSKFQTISNNFIKTETKEEKINLIENLSNLNQIVENLKTVYKNTKLDTNLESVANSLMKENLVKSISSDDAENITEIEKIIEKNLYDLKFDFSKLDYDCSNFKLEDFFYPIKRNLFYVLTTEIDDNMNKIFKLKILNEKLMTINEEPIKIDQAHDVKLSCEEKYLNLFFTDKELNSHCCTYEIGVKFHKKKSFIKKYKILYVNSDEIMVYKEAKSLIIILNHNLEKLAAFGQSDNDKLPFYFNKNGFEVLMLNKTRIYLKDTESKFIRIYDRLSGKCLKDLKDSSYSENVVVTKNGQIILLNKLKKNLLIIQENGFVLKEITLIDFSIEFDKFVLTNENELAFIYFSKNLIKFLKI